MSDAGGDVPALLCMDAGDVATHVLVVPTGGGTASLRPVVSATALPGLAVPAWSRVALGEPTATSEVSRAAADEAVVLLRVGLAARALAAAECTHELAVEHAKVRVQFGKPIGSFGAVQQRSAACAIDISGGKRLVDAAVRAFENGDDDRLLAAELATEFVRTAAPRVQLGAHHTLGAVGYFEEHVAPWLFRRVHGDVTRLQTITRVVGDVADVLVESGASLPSLHRDPIGEAFRAELRAFLAEQATTDEHGRTAYDDKQVVAAMATRRWWGFGWPEAAGGRGATLGEQVVLNEELEYGRVPATIALGAVMLLGNSILRHGTPAQQAEFLPLIRAGKLHFCLGYSEPEAGSDLASLRTRADRDGEEWVINGQKLWTTGGHLASHVWLAVRTDPDATPRHAGITVFLVPMNTPGITVQQHTALSGGVSCTVFYDDVRVPDAWRVGEVNGGWKVITDALAGERVLMGGIAASLHRQLDDLLAVVRENPEGTVGPRGSSRRARLRGLAATLQATRALVAAAIDATNAGAGARLEAPMAGVLGGELAEDFGEATLEILGPAAALSSEVPGVPGGGEFEHGLRLSIMYVVGGGTNDIQRGLIARGLGLPR